MNLTKQRGFTLIELVMVIVILGILAATALPRFADLTGDAREAAVNGMAGGLRSAVAITRSAYLAAGDNAAVTVNGVAVAAGTGIPTGTALGIGAAMTALDGFDVDYTDPDAVTFRPTNGGNATCQATYNGTTGAVAAPTGGC